MDILEGKSWDFGNTSLNPLKGWLKRIYYEHSNIERYCGQRSNCWSYPAILPTEKKYYRNEGVSITESTREEYFCGITTHTSSEVSELWNVTLLPTSLLSTTQRYCRKLMPDFPGVEAKFRGDKIIAWSYECFSWLSKEFPLRVTHWTGENSLQGYSSPFVPK